MYTCDAEERARMREEREHPGLLPSNETLFDVIEQVSTEYTSHTRDCAHTHVSELEIER